MNRPDPEPLIVMLAKELAAAGALSAFVITAMLWAGLLGGSI